MNLKALLLLACLSISIPSRAAFDYFLKVDGVPGESTDAQYPGAIEVAAFSWGVSNNSTIGAGGIGAGKSIFQNLQFTKLLDKSSPLLMTKCATGLHIPKVEFIVRKSGDKPIDYYRITLTDCIVSSVTNSGAAGDNRPAEQISFLYTAIKIDYYMQQPDGSVPIVSTFNYNLVPR
jgi:type VI secretion system secreted protein Hcp